MALKAHIISLSKGMVQIGSTIYQPFTNKKFPAPEYEVSEESMEEAKRVLIQYVVNSCK
ncbi:MAG: hypothetical protein JXR70_18220 [Spirochaetales bacterium]|nr:hypothetical protein [Spirochaetales bacterium]